MVQQQHLGFVAAMFASCFVAGYFAALEMGWEGRKRKYTALLSGIVGGILAFLTAHLAEPVRLFMLVQFPVAFFWSITDVFTHEIDVEVGNIPVFLAILLGLLVHKTSGLAGGILMLLLTAVWFLVNRFVKEAVSIYDFPFLWLVGVNGPEVIFVSSAIVGIASLVYMWKRRKTIPMIPYLTLGMVVSYAVHGVVTLHLAAPISG